LSDASEKTFYERVYDAVGRVPSGRVVTYGTVAEWITGRPGGARTVGWALRALTAERVASVPWWRVINASGRISTSSRADSGGEQRSLLEGEGVVFGPDGTIDLDRFGWWFE
jgi:methylated-DNA-protein-cysteine methyltransferase-like protein